MKKIENIAIGFILGAIPPVVGFLAFWWISIPLLPERLIPVSAILGLMIGLTIDIAHLKKWVAQAYDYGLKIWMGIYVFYSVCIFGFFMGVPVFNLVLAIPAGFFIGSKLSHFQAECDEYLRLVRQTCSFTTLVLALFCLVAAVIAISDPHTGVNLQGMFHLGFEVTSVMISGIIVLGGTMLLSLQWWITSETIHLAYRWTRS